jgi:glycosyltransferase involved in cell wall biosynthesis
MRNEVFDTTVTVVIPTFDRSGTIGRALDSVWAQTRAPNEIVVVDDGSTDDTGRSIERDYPQVTYVYQSNAGVSSARNRGVSIASSEWIAFLDSDDAWEPEKLERQLEALEQYPEYPLCHTNEKWIRNGRRVNEGRRHAKSGGWIFQRCLPLCVVSPSAAVVRRSLLEELGGFDESLPVCEDYDMWLRISASYPVLFLDEALTIKYGGHDDQLSRRYWGMDRFRIRAIEKILSGDVLSADDRAAAISVLIEKIDVYLEGARKRERAEEVCMYEELRERCCSSGS